MPGTIHVSVLEIIGVQPVTPSSQMLVKGTKKIKNAVSVGKREHQTWNKGDFSFPLTTLRDNVIVTIEDTDGNGISHTEGIDMRLLIGKGIWDGMFPLVGGGHVHLKLQFSLSEDDRERIRIMRESAMRKKHDELLISKSTNILQDLKGNHSASTNSSPVKNEIERREDTTSSSRVKEVKIERSLIFSTDDSLGTFSKRLKPLEKAHGNVRNMISAFESSSYQEMFACWRLKTQVFDEKAGFQNGVFRTRLLFAWKKEGRVLWRNISLEYEF
ncbi:hypothetical protein LINPERPRIM_LOCUS38006 [Linum perenne]